MFGKRVCMFLVVVLAKFPTHIIWLIYGHHKLILAAHEKQIKRFSLVARPPVECYLFLPAPVGRCVVLRSPQRNRNLLLTILYVKEFSLKHLGP